jgi:endonuclease-3
MMRESIKSKKARAGEIAARLARAFPVIRVPLVHRNPFELLVATILSAQSTDEQVNRITPALFRRYPDPEALAHAPLREIERHIRSLGLFHSKALALKESARQLVEECGSEVPASMEKLTRLKGVGRKTANVVLGHAFGIPGIVVDTHVKRLSYRLGLTKESDPNKIEQDLMRLVHREDWSPFSLRMIFHGRKTCHARKPQCGRCPLNNLCPSAQS